MSQQELKIGPIREFERAPVEALWHEQFGGWEERWEDDVIDAALGDRNRTQCFTIGSREALLAFLVVAVFDIEDFSERFKTDTRDWPKATRNAELSMICVADRAKNRGYATTLVERAYDWLRKWPVRRVFATSWNRAATVDSRLLFESLGYEVLGSEPAYYDQPEWSRRICPDCGRGCSCTASFHTRAIEVGGDSE